MCNPLLFFRERQELIALGFHPEVYAHPDCLITTPFDMLINQHKEFTRGRKRHGSCGIGFHETMVRSNVPELKITMSDLWNGGKRLESQLAEIAGKYFQFRTGSEFDYPDGTSEFIRCCTQFAECVSPLGIGQCKDPVFEGAQGLLLDQNNKEFFPHVTHSNTGMKNVDVLCAQAGITEREIYYVSRTYLTRHGAGPLPGEDSSLSYEEDTNRSNTFQGEFRFAPLDAGFLARCKKDAGSNDFRLVLTHCDQKQTDMDAFLYSEGPTREALSARASVVA